MTARYRRRFRTALLALCALLLAQWTLVTHACPVIGQAGRLLAEAHSAAAAAQPEPAGCHAAPEQPAAPDDTVCIKHCADEGSATGNGGVLSASMPAPLALRIEPPAEPPPPAWLRQADSGDATAPPLTILYCVSLS